MTFPSETPEGVEHSYQGPTGQPAPPEGYVSIAGLDKAAVLAALYNASQPLGLGFFHFDPVPMSTEQARSVIEECPRGTGIGRERLYFDYLKGRVMKVDLAGDSFCPWGYDRDNGQGAAARIIAQVRAEADLAKASAGGQNDAE